MELSAEIRTSSKDFGAGSRRSRRGWPSLSAGAAFPEGVEAPAQYGERLRAAAVYLHAQQLIPEERTAETLADLFGVPGLCPASVMDWVRRKASALAPVAGRIGALVAAARVRCLDETGFRVAAKPNGCTRVATESLTLYRISGKRGDVPNTLPGGVVVHDGFKSYGALESASHALCNAHHLRELKALIEFDQEPWAASMRDLLIDANRAVGSQGAGRKNARPSPFSRASTLASESRVNLLKDHS